MKEISRINHIGLRISDLATSRAFYEKLGFIFLAGPLGPEPVAIVEHPSGININFILNANQPEKNNILMHKEQKHTGYTHLALEITDTAPVIEQLAQKGIPLSGGPITVSSGTSLFIRDPDDNVIEFIKYTGFKA